MGIFIASFLAATVLPFSSEVVLAGVLLSGADYWPCMTAAVTGNVLGGMTGYWLGKTGKIEWIRKYLKMDITRLQKVQDWVEKRGAWVSLFTFLPAAGDFIAVALGFLRVNVWAVFIYMFIGKALRYFIWMSFVYKVSSAV